MTDRRNKGKYEVCQDCGAHLDHGEQCDCREEDSSQDAVYKAEDKFSIAVADVETSKIVGVAIVGRPVSRFLDDGWTLEVNRLCTDGTHNACSMLYAAAWRAARAMGYKRVITYILETENGTSLRAAGWKCIGQAGGLRWTGKRKPEVDLYPAQMKLRYEISLEG